MQCTFNIIMIIMRCTYTGSFVKRSRDAGRGTEMTEMARRNRANADLCACHSAPDTSPTPPPPMPHVHRTQLVKTHMCVSVLCVCGIIAHDGHTSANNCANATRIETCVCLSCRAVTIMRLCNLFRFVRVRVFCSSSSSQCNCACVIRAQPA